MRAKYQLIKAVILVVLLSVVHPGNVYAEPSSNDTQASLVNLAKNLHAAQDASFNYSLLQDCNLFNSKGICVSVIGAYTNVSNSNPDTTDGTLVVAKKFSDNLRIGGYIDQTIYTYNPLSSIQLENGYPSFGAFAVWNEKGSVGWVFNSVGYLGIQKRVSHLQDKLLVHQKQVQGKRTSILTLQLW